RHIIREVPRHVADHHVELHVAHEPSEPGLPGIRTHRRPLPLSTPSVRETALTPPLDVAVIGARDHPIVQVTRRYRDVGIDRCPGGVRTIREHGYPRIHYDVILEGNRIVVGIGKLCRYVEARRHDPVPPVREQVLIQRVLTLTDRCHLRQLRHRHAHLILLPKLKPNLHRRHRLHRRPRARHRYQLRRRRRRRLSPYHRHATRRTPHKDKTQKRRPQPHPARQPQPPTRNP